MLVLSSTRFFHRNASSPASRVLPSYKSSLNCSQKMHIIKSSITGNQFIVGRVSNTATKTVSWVVATSHRLKCFLFIRGLCVTEQGHFYFERPCASRSSFQNNECSPIQFRPVVHHSPPVQCFHKLITI